MSTPTDQMFNLVILPRSSAGSPEPLWQISATRVDGSLRLVSPSWQEAQLRGAMASLGVTNVQFENLLRGNRMANGGRDTTRIFFDQEHLLAAGLKPFMLPPTQPVEQ